MSVPLVFLRDDDVWTPDNNFRELFALLGTQRIPVIYGVIPDRLEEGMARLLRQAKERDFGLLDIVQHGLAHKNYAARGKDKYEFGSMRSYRQQYQDIQQGMRIMRRQFGRCWTPGFIPPYHGYDQATLKAVQVLRIPLFSAGKLVASPGKTFMDLPARVALNDYNSNSVPLAFSFRTMLARTLKALAPGKVTGAVYHHRAIRTSADMKAMTAYLRYMVRMRDEGKIRFVLFSELLRLRKTL